MIGALLVCICTCSTDSNKKLVAWYIWKAFSLKPHVTTPMMPKRCRTLLGIVRLYAPDQVRCYDISQNPLITLDSGLPSVPATGLLTHRKVYITTSPYIESI